MALDEMSIERGIVRHNGVTFGILSGSAGIINGNSMVIDDLQAATHITCIFVISLATNLRFPIFMYPTQNTITGEVLSKIFLDVLTKVTSIGLDIVGAISDCGDGERKLQRKLGITKEKPYYRNAATGKKVFFLPDPPHVLKRVRNALLNDTTSLVTQFGPASFAPLITLYERNEADAGLNACVIPIGAILLDRFTKMRVKYADVICSQLVTDAISMLGSKASPGTVAYLEAARSWWGIVNSSYFVNSKSFEEIKRSLVASANFYTSWQADEAIPHENKLHEELHDDILLMIRSFCGILDRVFSEPNTAGFCVYPRALNQDVVEGFFSRLRHGANSNPTLLEATNRRDKVLFSGICQPEIKKGQNSQESALNVSSKFVRRKRKDRLQEETPHGILTESEKARRRHGIESGDSILPIGRTKLVFAKKEESDSDSDDVASYSDESNNVESDSDESNNVASGCDEDEEIDLETTTAWEKLPQFDEHDLEDEQHLIPTTKYRGINTDGGGRFSHAIEFDRNLVRLDDYDADAISQYALEHTIETFEIPESFLEMGERGQYVDMLKDKKGEIKNLAREVCRLIEKFRKLWREFGANLHGFYVDRDFGIPLDLDEVNFTEVKTIAKFLEIHPFDRSGKKKNKTQLETEIATKLETTDWPRPLIFKNARSDTERVIGMLYDPVLQSNLLNKFVTDTDSMMVCLSVLLNTIIALTIRTLVQKITSAQHKAIEDKLFGMNATGADLGPESILLYSFTKLNHLYYYAGVVLNSLLRGKKRLDKETREIAEKFHAGVTGAERKVTVTLEGLPRGVRLPADEVEVSCEVSRYSRGGLIFATDVFFKFIFHVEYATAICLSYMYATSSASEDFLVECCMRFSADAFKATWNSLPRHCAPKSREAALKLQESINKIHRVLVKTVVTTMVLEHHRDIIAHMKKARRDGKTRENKRKQQADLKKQKVGEWNAMVAAVFKNSSAGIRHLVSFTNSLKDFALLDDKTILNHRLQLLTVKQLKRVSLVLEADNGQSVAIMQTSQKEALINRLADKLRSTRIVDVVRPQRVLSPVSLKAAFLAALDEQKTFSEFR
jgi:hypothetical protein